MRKVADCRTMPSESGCSLTIAGEADEVMRAAAEHAVSVHGHEDGADLRAGIAAMLADEDAGTALLRGGYEAFARGDVDGVMAMLDPEIVWTAPPTTPDGGTFHGPAEVGTFFARIPETYAELRVEPERYVEQGDTVVVLGRHRGRTAGGAPLDLAFVHTWTIRDGLVVRFDEQLDTAALNALLSVPAPRAGDRALTDV